MRNQESECKPANQHCIERGYYRYSANSHSGSSEEVVNTSMCDLGYFLVVRGTIKGTKSAPNTAPKGRIPFSKATVTVFESVML